ncbi:unnamed protein product, partial [Rotaria socialis]
MAEDKKAKPAKKNEHDLDDLKRELEIDDHKVSAEELYRRYDSDPDR